MSPRTIRRLVLLVFLGGIAGMIVGSIQENNGIAITFGLITAGAAVGLILVTAVAPADAFRPTGAGRGSSADGEAQDASGALVEEQVELLVAGGADEGELRELVRRSIAFGRRSSRG